MKNISYTIVMVLLLSSCFIFTREDVQLEVFLPRETDVPGWKIKFSKVRKGTGKLKRSGMRDIVKREYTPLSEKKNRLRVEVMRFENPFRALLMYFSDKGSFDRIVEVQENCHWTKRGLYCIRGEYYIKVKSKNTVEIVKEDVNFFMNFITGNLNGYVSKNDYPLYIKTFSENKKKGNLIFYREGIEKIPNIRGIFVREKKILGKTKHIFFSKKSSSFEAIKKYNAQINSERKQYVISEFSQRKWAYKKNNDNNFVFISLYKDLIFGVLNADNLNNGRKIILKLYGDLENKR
ncbi:DUF6599 family protein [Spirochaetota bacterium]